MNCDATCPVPHDHSPDALGGLLSPCTLPVGHSGSHGNGLSSWAAPSRVEMIGGAIVVSDVDPEDAQLIRNATTVLSAARAVVGDSAATLGEMRFAARCLADSLNDVLSVTGAEVDSDG